MDADILARAVELSTRREPFALATVVWRRAPSSGHVGSKAIIRADGTIDGWLGGACAQPTVQREAIAAIGDGRPRLLFLGQPDDLNGQPSGVVLVPMACESEGALEIYLEPVLPAPQLVVIGRSPAVFALTRLAGELGWSVTVIDQDGTPDDHPLPHLVRTRLDLSELTIGAASAVVVATQGTYDDLALEAALGTDAGYIGLVAAEKRASATLGLLHDRGVAADQLGRVHAPAGLDLGPVDNAGIAVAILAELVARRAAGGLIAPPVTTGPRAAIDPVCGMTVLVDRSHYRVRHRDTDQWFCSPGCLATFEAQPDAYPAPS
jgi:xanthine dehydrogenase accessory factor